MRACNTVVSVLNARTRAPVDVLLLNGGHLSLVASGGAWQAPHSVPVHYGIVGRVLATGRTVSIGDASIAYAGLHHRRPVGSVVCAPISCPSLGPMGVLNLEFDRLVPGLGRWRGELTEIALRLGARIAELGGPPAESGAERLLRHTLAFAAAQDRRVLAELACRAAVETSGLSSAALLVRRVADTSTWLSPDLALGMSYTVPGGAPLTEHLAKLDRRGLSEMIDAVCRHGASQTLGDPSLIDARGFEQLVDAGVRTLIAVPVRGIGVKSPLADAAMLVMDQLAIGVDPTVVSVLELLMANAAMCYERLYHLARLRDLADSDPLTGLPHLGPFTERLAAASAGRTALLVIDVDDFKQVNDTLGHAAGDQLLIRLADALRDALRAGDEVFRVGGDEFVAVLDVPDEAEAVRIARRLAAAAHGVGNGISVGVALRRQDEPAEATLRRADEAMYLAKEDDQVEVRLAV
ncbi:GGDEF domain-containing protein [Catellatospora sp. KI3]|uniref:GGDEF domain-containing protein n=1 Tax=Catellatospora sp. KI3 TaxID=3041620 RepID=UPI0024828323|nr:GGDEF domain-containing protein [Catellatospora sp. KI3]MDI1464013.1 GGDEF domain-containing protein [Catellatospora sp. KI3]